MTTAAPRLRSEGKGDNERMRSWRITGGRALEGAVRVGGSKYSALAAIPACTLADGPCVLHNVPDIADVRSYLDMLTHCGATVRRYGSSVQIDAHGLRLEPLPVGWTAELRASTYMLAVQLVRWGQTEVGLPGGDHIGSRPLDQHVMVLRAMGAEVGPSADCGSVCGRVGTLRGAHIYSHAGSRARRRRDAFKECVRGTLHRRFGQIAGRDGRRHPRRWRSQYSHPWRKPAARR